MTKTQGEDQQQKGAQAGEAKSGDNTEIKKFATETMVEVAKMQVTLASSFIVISVSLLQLLTPDGVAFSDLTLWPLFTAWILFVLTILFGLLSLGSIAGTSEDKLIYDLGQGPTLHLLRAQQIAFLLSFLLLVCFAGNNVTAKTEQEQRQSTASKLLAEAERELRESRESQLLDIVIIIPDRSPAE